MDEHADRTQIVRFAHRDNAAATLSATALPTARWAGPDIYGLRCILDRHYCQDGAGTHWVRSYKASSAVKPSLLVSALAKRRFGRAAAQSMMVDVSDFVAVTDERFSELFIGHA
jgi:hypothetical protein